MFKLNLRMSPLNGATTYTLRWWPPWVCLHDLWVVIGVVHTLDHWAEPTCDLTDFSPSVLFPMCSVPPGYLNLSSICSSIRLLQLSAHNRREMGRTGLRTLYLIEQSPISTEKVSLQSLCKGRCLIPKGDVNKSLGSLLNVAQLLFEEKLGHLPSPSDVCTVVFVTRNLTLFFECLSPW